MSPRVAAYVVLGLLTIEFAVLSWLIVTFGPSIVQHLVAARIFGV